MSSARPLLPLLFLLGCASAAPEAARPPQDPPPAPPPPAPKAPVAPVPIDTYFQIHRMGNYASFSYDEKWIAFSTDLGGRMDVWVAPVEGGEPKQVTHVSGFVHSYRFSPTSDQLAYETDQGGNELPHVFLTNLNGDAPKDLMASDPPGARTSFMDWANDGKRFFYLSNRRDQTLMDLYEYDIKSGASELLWQAPAKWLFARISLDGKHIIVREILNDIDDNLYLIERGKKGKPVLLTPHKGEVRHEATDFSKDGKFLYYTSDENSEFTALYVMDLKKKKAQPVLKEPWDVEVAGFSKGGKYFYTRTNVDGTPKTVLTELKSRKVVPLPGASESLAYSPIVSSKSDRYWAVQIVSDATPSTIAVIDMLKSSVKPVLNPLPEALNSHTMAVGQAVRVPSFDQKEVPAFVYTPAGEGPFPAVIDVHGGPTSQSRRSFDVFRQYLVSKGYVVMVPNVRGSTGYGRSYTKLDDLDLGGGPLKDILACKDELLKSHKVDADKVVILGGSYGGYMTLAAATFQPTAFAAHVDYFGVSDLKSLVESFPPYWASFSTFIYKKFGDPKNPEHAQYQHDRSPANFVDQIQRPLLVVQGENDARVKKDQSDRIVDSLKARGAPVHYLVLPGEGHGFTQNQSRLSAYQATDRFLDHYVFGDTSVVVTP